MDEHESWQDSKLLRIFKEIASRLIFVVFNTIAVWRTITTLQSSFFALLLVTIVPLFVESYYATLNLSQNEFKKWINPTALCFLTCAIPCVWLLELRLFNERTSGKLFPWIELLPPSTNTTLQDDVTVQLNWVVGLEQMIIFCLVVAKWIAPKRELTVSQFSELLLIYISSGADIVELLEIFEDPVAQRSLGIVVMVLCVWSWSLLQFAVELTATKTFPLVDEDIMEEDATRPSRVSRVDEFLPETLRTGRVKESSKDLRDDHQFTFLLRNEEKIALFQQMSTRRCSCYNYFCFYNEIWGLGLGLLLQDCPYFIVRVFIIIQYRIITQLNIFFLCKNVFLIILHVNRIRVIYREDGENWKEYRQKVLDYDLVLHSQRRKRNFE